MRQNENVKEIPQFLSPFMHANLYEACIKVRYLSVCLLVCTSVIPSVCPDLIINGKFCHFCRQGSVFTRTFTKSDTESNANAPVVNKEHHFERTPT